jgi:hypothetical protein
LALLSLEELSWRSQRRLPNTSKPGGVLAGENCDSTVAERQQLVAANEAFAKRLTRARRRGDETMDGILATATEPLKYFQPWRINRMRVP